MGKISLVRKCYSCGAILQSDDPTKEGYVKKETLENPSQNFLFCDKCFEAERYHGSTAEVHVTEEYLNILRKGKENHSLFVYVVNVFSFESAFSPKINEVIKDENLIVVANKFDTMPIGTSKEHVKDYVIHRFKVCGLRVKPENVVIASSLEEESAKEVLELIYEKKGNSDVYLLGSKQAGKSTLLSNLLKYYSNVSQQKIQTFHNVDGEDGDMVKIPLSKRASIYDTPGFVVMSTLLYSIPKSKIKNLNISKPIEAKEISLFKGQALYVGGFGFIELLDGEKTKFSCYFSDKIKLSTSTIHRNPVKKYFDWTKSGKLYPFIPSITSIKDFDVYDLDISEKNNRDIGILGLGWVKFVANNQKFRVYVPHNVAIYTSRSKI